MSDITGLIVVIGIRRSPLFFNTLYFFRDGEIALSCSRLLRRLYFP
jgi:hypothetical protein